MKKKYEDDENNSNSLTKLTVVMLKAELKARGLTISGNKLVRKIEQLHQKS